MVTQEAVLRWLARRTKRNESTGYEDLAQELWVSPEAACGHLARLWRSRLIEAKGDRRTRFQFRLEPGESLRALRFTLAGRGRKRLRWYEEEAKRERGRLGWL
jgi:predicted ArsR family transcriptional regulator